MRIDLAGLTIDLTDDQAADLRRQLSVPDPGEGMVDAATLAKRLGVSREHVYAHAEELGGQKIGNGPRARWRFDPAKLAPASPEQQVSAPEPKPQRRRRQPKRSGLLEVQGSSPYAR
jgi:hypothetical protein